ncbi:MAG: metallophosphoesterase [Clostridia bacterium]|nr:metallophosphoesterase [Clostridia bacterium]
MKIIHTADLHLDSAIDTLPTDKSRVRRDEILRTFERTCEYAKINGVKVVIIAGDAFDSPRVSKKTAGRFAEAIKSAADTDFLYLSGNHDRAFLKTYGEILPDNFKVFKTEWTTFRYDNVAITGIALDKFNAPFAYDNLRLNEKETNIVCMHGQVLGYKSEEAAETISIPLLKNKFIDYLALGHIHSFSEGVIDERGKFAYCGCPDGRGFDETGVKGFVLIDTDSGAKGVKTEFVPFCSRIFTEKEYSVDGEKSFYALRNRIVEEMRATFAPESIVKVILTGGHDADFIVDKEDLALRLNENFFFAKVYDKTAVKVSEKDYAFDKSVRGEFVRKVLSSDLTEEEKNAVILTGLNALKGEL